MTKTGKRPIHVDCERCPVRTDDRFCGLEQADRLMLSSIKSMHAYPRGETIFFEGQPATGVYILCSGRVKLSTNSEEGRSIIVRVVEPGEVLALSATVTGAPLEGSASAIDDCTVSFVSKRDFTSLLNGNRPIAVKALKELGRVYRNAYTRICTLGLSSSVGEKLARLFLEWCDKNRAEGGAIRIPLTYTHEEMAEMIGSSRETVTRLLRTFRDRGLISFEGNTLLIPDKRRLRGLIGGAGRTSGKISGGNCAAA